MDFQSKVVNFLNDRKKNVQQLVQQIPQPVQSFGNTLRNQTSNYLQGVQQRFNTPSKIAPPLPANNPIRSFVAPIFNEAQNYITKQAPAAQRTLGLVLNNPYQRDQSIQHYTNVFRNNSFQNSIKDVGLDLYNTGKFAANTLGGAKMLTGGLLNSVKTILPTAVISGGLNKAMGGSFLEGAGQGVAISPSIRGITGITNPFIERTTQRLAPRIAPKLTNNPIGNYLTTSTIRGLQNIPEGAAIDATLGHRPMGAMSMFLDFGSGFLPGGGRVGRASNVNANAKVEPMAPKDRDFVTKTLQKMLENKDNADYQIRFRQQAEDDIRQVAEGYTNKEFAWKQPFERVAQEVFERAKIDGGDKPFDLPSMGIMAGQKATGFKNAPNKFSSVFDKKPRFEIDDSGAKIKGSIDDIINELPYDRKLAVLGSGEGVKLGDLLEHPALFKNYPELKNVSVKQLSLEHSGHQGTKASYSPELNQITISTDRMGGKWGAEERKTLLHEIQHAIQTKEGFARGGSPSGLKTVSVPKNLKDADFRRFVQRNNIRLKLEANGFKFTDGEALNVNKPEVRRAINQLAQTDSEMRKLIQEVDGLNSQLSKYSTANEQYQRLGGELESRSVAHRADLTPQQRATTLPYSDQGIKAQDVITRFDDGGVAGSVKVKPQAQIQKEVGGAVTRYEKIDTQTLQESLDMLKANGAGNSQGAKDLQTVLDSRSPEQTANNLVIGSKEWQDFYNKQTPTEIVKPKVTLQEGRANLVLDKKIRYNGKVMTRSEYIDALKNDGYVATQHTVNGKTSYAMKSPNGDYYDVSKIEYTKALSPLKSNVANPLLSDIEKKQFYIRNGLNELVQAENAKSINLGNNIEAFSHRFGKGTGVAISEARTGMQIATGKTEKEAIANAQKAFKDLRGITPQQLIERQLKSLPQSDIISRTGAGKGRQVARDLSAGKETIPHKEVSRSGNRRIMSGANPDPVITTGTRRGAEPRTPLNKGFVARESLIGKSQLSSRLSQERAKIDQLSGDGALPLGGSSSSPLPQGGQKQFTQKGSFTNTRDDQIAKKFRLPDTAPQGQQSYRGKISQATQPEAPLKGATQQSTSRSLIGDPKTSASNNSIQRAVKDDFEAEMDALVGKTFEKPFTGKSRIKVKQPTQLPGDKSTTDFATGQMAMGGGGIKNLPKETSDQFQLWVNTRRATEIEGVLKAKEFKDLDGKGIEGIFEFQSGNKTGRFGDVKRYFDAKYKTLQDNKIEFDYRQDYLPQLWNNSQEEIQQVFGRKLGTRPSFTIEALFKSYQEGIDAGLKPKFGKISDLVRWYEQKANKAIADKKFFDYLGKDGQILPSGKAPMEWQTLDPDRFPRFLSQIGDEKFAGAYKAPKELADVINNYLQGSRVPLLEAVANYVSRVKNITLNFGIPGTGINMHGVNILARHTLLGTGSNPIGRFLKGSKFMVAPRLAQKELDTTLARAPKAIKNGLSLSAEDYSGLTKQGEGFRAKFGQKWEAMFGDPLFNKMIPALKLSSYEELVKGGMDGKNAAKIVNNVYGGINWEQMGRSKDMQNLIRTAILAPDWAESTLRIGGNMAKAVNPLHKSETANRYRTMMATVFASYVAHNIVNKITSGHYSYENGPSDIFNIQIGYTESGEKRFFRPYGTGLDFARLPAEVAMGLAKGDLTGITRLLRNRLSIPAGVGLGLLTDQDYRGQAIGYRGTDKFGNQMPLDQRVGNITSELASLVGVPSFSRQFYKSASGQQGLEEGLTQGFELPFRYSNTGNSNVQKQVNFVAGDKKGQALYDFNQSLKGQNVFSDNQLQSIKSADNPEQGLKDVLEIRKMRSDANKIKDELSGKSDSSTNQAHASEKFLNNTIYYSDGGSVKSIDLSPPTKGTGIGAFVNQDWNITKARQVWNAKISQESKDQAFKKLNVKSEDVRYDALANYDVDIKAQYLSSKSDTKEKLVENILSGRQRSIGDKIFASDGVIDAMVDEGRLTKAEAKYLKSIDYNKDGTLKKGTGSGGKKGTLKVDFRKLVQTSQRKTTKMTAPQLKTPFRAKKITAKKMREFSFKGKPFSLKKKYL